MAAYVLLTIFLFQKGSPESKKPDEPNLGGRAAAQTAGRAGCARSGPPGRPAAEALFAFAQPRPRDAVPPVVLAASGGEHPPMNEEALQHHQPLKTMIDMLVGAGVLVRELPELAERVPVHRRAAGAGHLPARTRLTGVEARRSPAHCDRALS